MNEVSSIHRVLVTGGAGFIGSHFVKAFLAAYPQKEVVILDILSYAGNLENLEGVLEQDNVLFVQGDIGDVKTVSAIVASVDAIVHFAAETHVDRSVLFADQFIKTDIHGTYVLLEAARQSRIKKFIYISTDEVYGEALSEPCTENHPLFPKSPYAASKAGADRLAFSYFITYHTPVVITRGVNNYGPYQHPEKMLALFITQALQDQPLPVYGRGESVREWLFVEDHCQALLQLLFTDGLEGEVFNIGSGEEKSVLEVAEFVLSYLGKPKDLIHLVADRPGHVLRHAVNSEKLRRAISWKPAVSWEEGMKRTIDWYRENEGWWRRVRSRREFESFFKSWYKERIKL